MNEASPSNPARRIGLIALVPLLMLAACASPTPSGPRAPASSGQPSAAPKRITLAVMDNLSLLNERITEAGGSTSLGGEEVEWLVLAGLTRLNDQGVRVPQLAEATPTLENGLWKLLPGGGMETTFKIRGGARWHDGTAFTADDVIFTSRIFTDRDLDLRWNPAFDSLESITAPDPRTLVISWKAPFIDADAMFDESLMPRHLLENAYLESKAGFLRLPYWNVEFVGTGPYRVKEFQLGSHVLLAANPDYVLGKPKIDEIEVRFFPDGSTLIASVLAGVVDVTVGRGISVDQSVQLTNIWREGRVLMPPESWVAVYPQMLDSNPAVVSNLQFRRALVYGTDRQQMADAIQHGQVPVADAIFSPGRPFFKDIERGIVRYSYDPAGATRILQDLGYQRGADGMLRDPTGQKLEVELRAVETDINKKSVLATADYWQKLGVSADAFFVPRARARDPEYRATFPGFELTRQPTDTSDLKRYHSNQARLPGNNFTGSNYMRYISPQWDGLLDRFYITIPRAERMAVLTEIVHYMSENVLPIGLFHDARPVLVRNRLLNVTGHYPGWNAEQWDLGG